LHNGISTRDAQPGTQVYLETTFPVVVNDRIVIPVGSYAQGEITEAKRPAKGKGGAEIRMRLTTLILPNGYTVKLEGLPTNADNGNGAYASKEGGQINKDRDKGADAGTVITTTGAGAGIGAIAAGAKGAGIGAGIGAATGLAGVMMTRGPELELPRGSTVDVVLDRPVYLDPAKINFNESGRATALPAPPPRQPARTRLPF
jgi:type IV secretion system protein VirB10